MEIKIIGVVGAGQMGSGIALAAARGGFPVVMQDIREDLVQRGANAIAQFLDKDISKGSTNAADKAAILQRIKSTTDLRDRPISLWISKTLPFPRPPVSRELRV